MAPASFPDPFTVTKEGVAVRVRLTPKASADRVAGMVRLGDGTSALKASVTAAPEGGKANAQLIRLLAKTWKFPKSALRVGQGPKSRSKTIVITGDPAMVLPRLAAWLDAATTEGR